MKRLCPFIYLVAFASALFLLSCGPKSSPAVAGEGDLAGFELSSITGSEIQYASRRDAAGHMVMEGYMLDGKKTGLWMEYTPENNPVTMEHYVNGLREGPSFKYGARGQIDMKSTYHEGQLHGEWIQYKYGRPIEERNYKMGNLDGTVRTYDDRNWKLKQEAQYRDGKQHGYFRYYDENGNVTLEYEYNNGEKVSGGMIEKK